MADNKDDITEVRRIREVGEKVEVAGLGQVREDLASVKTELRWHKWLLFGLMAAVFSPKLGGPAPADLASALFPLV